MSIEPYRRRAAAFDPADDNFAPGRTYGDPRVAAEPAPKRRRPNVLALRAQRRRTDPNWASYSREVQRQIIELDRRAGL